jgi:transglutaminase-like putative cysteine protease
MNAHPAVDHLAVDWSTIRRTAFVVEQELRYHYPGPVHDLHQCLMVIPADEHGGQRLLRQQVQVSVAGGDVRWETDRFGNKRLRLHLARVDGEVEFRIFLEIERHVQQAAAACDMRQRRLYLEPTPLTAPEAPLRAVAEDLRATGLRGLDLAGAIMAWVHTALRYEQDVTGIHTTAAQALALGRGVCQDYAQIMLVLCRLCQLPARYVSGHLLGEGATHAWVEVLVPDSSTRGGGVAVAFDPTHNRRTGPTYITVAVGRDYRDVAPTSGTFRAPYGGRLVARKYASIALLEPFGDVA